MYIILLCGTSQAQTAFSDKDRAVYILDIIKYIKWSNEENLFQYKIVVLDKDSLLYHHIHSLSKARQRVHGKPIAVELVKSIESIPDCQVLYTDRKLGFDIQDIIQKINGNSILLITENYEFHRSMINFIVVDDQKRFEVNEHMLKEHNLKATPLFLALAVNNRRDWESLFFKTDSMLLREKDIVKKQNETINRQNEDIEKQIERIIEQKNKILLQEARLNKQQQQLQALSEEIDEKQQILGQQQQRIQQKEDELEGFKKEILVQTQIREKQQKEIAETQLRIRELNENIIQAFDKIDRQQMYILYFLALILLLVAFAIFIYRSFKIKKRINKELEEKNEAILERNEEILQQKEEILAQRDEIEAQRDKILKQNVEITDSILYARRIQNAILPRKEILSNYLPEHFVFYLPRDIVSGDFYWISKKEHKVVFVVADCTGHGVPGAFMSMLGVSLLNELVAKSDLKDASTILEDMRHMVKTTLSQTGKKDETKDGMDMVLCILDEKQKKLDFAGANNPLFLIRNNELTKYVPDKMPIGIFINDNNPFTHTVIDIRKNDCIYMFSDGFVDQFGGPKGKKFNSKQFKQLLIEINEKPMQEQKDILKETYFEWITSWTKGEEKYPQVDDILVAGIKIH